MVDWGVSADTLIIRTFLSAPACTDMVSSKELERDVTTNAMAKEPPPENVGIIVHDRFDFLRPKDE